MDVCGLRRLGTCACIAQRRKAPSADPDEEQRIAPPTPSRCFTPRLTLTLALASPAASIDHTPQPHPASPTNQTPATFAQNTSSSFSKYREHAQQFGPLRKTIRTVEEAGVGGLSGSELGPVRPNQPGVFFDRSELPARFRRQPLTAAEIEAIETGGAAMFA